MSISINETEKSLWEAADQLRANSKLTATEYSMPVLGLIFLRFAYNRFLLIKEKLEAALPVHAGRGRRELTKEEFLSEKAIFLPEKSRFDYLTSLPDGSHLGEAINEAMKAIEDEYPNLAGVLPREYHLFEDHLLRDLLRIFDRDSIRNIQGDAFGKIYEYFLNEFAITGAQEGGEFFTPSSLVNTIVNVIRPDHGIVLDPACGSAGMFVQTGHFIEQEGFNPGEKITIYGQEKTTTNTRIAKMNLAVHGLEGKIAEVNSFYADEFELAGKCDFVMANPPFNVDGVDKGREFVKNDSRLLYTVDAGGTKVRLLPKADNANYLWIQYFYGYLNETGRAGFVMASSASDAGYSEKDIRERLVKTGAVDVMIAIGTNFFYTRSLPCTLWFFDRAKEKNPVLAHTTLMLDARSIYRVVTRKINDFSDEQLQNITTIVELYRGNSTAFTGLIDKYLTSAAEQLNKVPAAVIELGKCIASHYMRLFTPLHKTKDGKELLDVFEAEERLFEIQISKVKNAVKTYIEGNDTAAEISRSAGEYATLNRLQHTRSAELNAAVAEVKIILPLAESSVKLLGQLTEKMTALLKTDNAPKDLKASDLKKEFTAIEAAQRSFLETVKATGYFLEQILWMQERFPDAEYADVEGLCKVVTREDIANNDYSLTPGRYVGVAPRNDDDDNFAERLKSIHLELEALNDEAITLAKTISKNFEELGI